MIASNLPIILCTFIIVILSAILLLRPTFLHYIHNYQVRVRPVKSSKDTSASEPKNSVILIACMTIGQIMLSALPSLADKRAVELLTFANYRTPKHLAIYTGVRTIAAGTILFLGIVAGASSAINFVLSVPAAILGWLMPNFFLSQRAKRRQQQIVKELPIIIDLMIVCAQAGLGMLQA